MHHMPIHNGPNCNELVHHVIKGVQGALRHRRGYVRTLGLVFLVSNTLRHRTHATPAIPNTFLYKSQSFPIQLLFVIQHHPIYDLHLPCHLAQRTT